MTAADVLKQLQGLATPAAAASAARFFKAGPGEYAEGDTFLGIKVPVLRALSRQCRTLPLPDVQELLMSEWHESRHLALMILVLQAAKADDTRRKTLFDFYRDHTGRVNNWDLVDCSAPALVGGYLIDQPRKPLYRWAKSKSLWERRIAIVATQHFIRAGDLADTFALAERLLNDTEDLIHKASGWMLREAGEQSKDLLLAFLDLHAPAMPRTMLRYAIEKFPPAERQHYLALKRR